MSKWPQYKSPTKPRLERDYCTPDPHVMYLMMGTGLAIKQAIDLWDGVIKRTITACNDGYSVRWPGVGIFYRVYLTGGTRPDGHGGDTTNWSGYWTYAMRPPATGSSVSLPPRYNWGDMLRAAAMDAGVTPLAAVAAWQAFAASWDTTYWQTNILQLKGWGYLKKREQKARRYKHPVTGVTTTAPAKWVNAFRQNRGNKLTLRAGG